MLQGEDLPSGSVRSPFSAAREVPDARAARREEPDARAAKREEPDAGAAKRRESSPEEATPSQKASLGGSRGRSKEKSPQRSHRGGRHSTSAKKHNQDPSHSYLQRRTARRNRRRHGDGTHKRRRRTHGSRRRRSSSHDKRRRSESSGKERSSKKKNTERKSPPPVETTRLKRQQTTRCPHCWAEVTVQPSGRAQHQWSNRLCLQWQFYNDMDPKFKQKDEGAAWKKAKDAAAALYERRRHLPAPMPQENQKQAHRSEAPVVLRSRSTVQANAAEEEMEEVEIEEEPGFKMERQSPAMILEASASRRADASFRVPIGKLRSLRLRIEALWGLPHAEEFHSAWAIVGQTITEVLTVAECHASLRQAHAEEEQIARLKALLCVTLQWPRLWYDDEDDEYYRIVCFRSQWQAKDLSRMMETKEDDISYEEKAQVVADQLEPLLTHCELPEASWIASAAAEIDRVKA
eukprot:s296_g25.t1